MKYSSLDQFPKAMVLASEAAVNQEIFYESDFKKYVLDNMNGYGCEAVLLGIFSMDQTTEDFLKNYHQMVKNVESNVKALPRGHYAIIERIGVSSSYSMIVSDGTGEVATGGKYNSYSSVPTADQVLDCMVGYEIYMCRKLIEKRNAKILEQNIMNSHKFYVGQVFKNLQSDEVLPKHKFGTTTIVEIQSDLQIKINSTKRGTKALWSGSVSPIQLSKMIEWSQPKLSNNSEKNVGVYTLF